MGCFKKALKNAKKKSGKMTPRDKKAIASQVERFKR